MREYLEQGLLPSTTLHCSALQNLAKKYCVQARHCTTCILARKYAVTNNCRTHHKVNKGRQKESGCTKVPRISTIIVFK